eukprot:scaffold5684_cov54-Phaeocystis_antarctica.AAC.1
MLDSWERECGGEFVLVASEVGDVVSTLIRAPCRGGLELVERFDRAQQLRQPRHGGGAHLRSANGGWEEAQRTIPNPRAHLGCCNPNAQRPLADG